MELVLPEGPPLRFSGRVVTRKERLDEPRPRREIGIEFLDMPPADRQRLEGYLSTL
jgi:hypothetical protein